LGGVGVNATTLTELLWPESEGDAAQRVFHTSLHRLRKLLGDESAIVLEDGKLSFNVALCWSDVTAFESVAKQVEAVCGNQDTTADGLVKFAERLMDLYRGPLLAQEDDKPWLPGPRDRLRSLFRRLVSRVGQGLESQSDFEAAISIYRKALERDNLSEEIYRRLMDCHQRRGEYAEGLNVYRRCRELLSVVLGVRPSQQTQKVYESIRQRA
jgi:LuxR family transcriptional regulator, maltose regulon positive regulatory protein